MKIPKLMILTAYMVLAGAIVGGSLWLDTRRRNDERLADAHLTYSRSCSGCVANFPRFQVDLFGDGTIILQSASDSDGESYVAHVAAEAAKDYFASLDADSDWRRTHPTVVIDGAS